MDVRARGPVLVVGTVLAAGTAFLTGRLTAPHPMSSRVLALDARTELNSSDGW
jgi:hypothetical protein